MPSKPGKGTVTGLDLNGLNGGVCLSRVMGENCSTCMGEKATASALVGVCIVLSIVRSEGAVARFHHAALLG